ncbi:uncharacterized protein LOC132293978 [Cornus florida]|uniref:uncharacterized protein LOC132293978 n=1 Tax=Cornus florida TaxID=4283 RepID=UPI00289CD231|nr:uncharacterized protein LOC132293978 [Cornus florida]
MPDHIVQSYNDDDGSAGQSMHSYQSVWMAHWMRTSCTTTPQVHNFLPPHRENKENDYDVKRPQFLGGLEIASGISTSAKRFRERTEAGTVKIMNENLTTGSKNLINQRLDCQPFPVFNLGLSSCSSSAPKNDQDSSCHRLAVRPPQIDHNSKHNKAGTSNFPLVLAVGPPATEATSREFYFKSQGIPQNPIDQANSHKFLGDSSLAVARPSPGSSFICRQVEDNQLTSALASKEHFSNANCTILEHERCNYRSHSTFLFCERTMDNHKSGNSKTFNSPMSLHDSNYHLPVLVGEQYQKMHNWKMQNSSGIGLFPSHSSRLKDDVETTRPCTTANSVDGLPGGPTKFSQTKHSRLITETEVSLSKENRMFRESRVSTKFSELLSSPPVIGQDQQGVKLQPPASSTDGEGKEIVKDVKASEACLKNESSTETDTMDMDAFKDNHISGDDDSSPSNKDIKVGPDLSSQATIDDSTGGEVGCKRPITMLPDINEELPSFPAAVSTMDNGEPSSARTQSLDAEHLLAHAEQFSNSKYIPLTGSMLGPEPTSRWVKRLKPIASDSFALGTKSTNLGEATSHEKAKKFNRIMKGNISSSEMILGTCHDKESMVLDQTATLLGDGESSSINKSKAGRDAMLSHFWIQRWCHNANLQKKPKAVAVCEPQSSKVPFDELHKKQFPSIAAMALMGKAMSCFQPCEFQKRGSFIVWN